MLIRWYGQSAFLIRGERSVLIDPFGSGVAGLAERGLRFDYPPIARRGRRSPAHHPRARRSQRRRGRERLATGAARDRRDARLAAG